MEGDNNVRFDAIEPFVINELYHLLKKHFDEEFGLFIEQLYLRAISV
jgi:hypothetical protein